jgi:hypothetical protein
MRNWSRPINLTVIGTSFLMAALALLFAYSPGLVDTEGRLVSTYNSTGGDDGLMITLAIPIFLFFAMATLAFNKWLHGFVLAFLFTLDWLVQLWCLDWLEAASIGITLRQPQGIILGAFLGIFAISLPAVWILAISEHRKAQRTS